MFHMKQSAISSQNIDKSMTLQVGVKIFLQNKEGAFLLLKRNTVLYPNIKNIWDIPGGRIIPGSDLLKNLQREVTEETKLKIIGTPKLIFAQDILRPEKHIVRLTFIGKCKGKVSLNAEHDEYKWLTFKEMLHVKRLDEFTREVIRKLSLA